MVLTIKGSKLLASLPTVSGSHVNETM